MLEQRRAPEWRSPARACVEGGSMRLLSGIDHVAITAADVDASCGFYQRLFGAEVWRDFPPGGPTAVRVIDIGDGVRLSVHQAGNGVDLVAARPTPGSVDICFRWAGSIDEAAAHVKAHGLAIIDGPSPRQTVDGKAAHSIYFRDPDSNLIELMAGD
jgi:catechol 2,3-dioxygenase-like lactoylglutathione lyase family enzyme